MATPDASSTSPVNKALLGKLFAHPANDTVAHIVRVLSTATGIDSTFLLLGYFLKFVSDQLDNFVNLNLRALAERLAENASKTLLPGETVVASLPAPATMTRIANLRDATKILSGMCSDVRSVMRLWGLLKIWLMAKATYLNPPKDRVLKALAWGQMVSISGYYVLEHGFYLASKGVYKWDPKDIARSFRVAIYWYGAYLAMDYARLYREAKIEEAKTPSEKMDAAKKETADRLWYKALQINAGYTPLCFHWAAEGGIFSESWVGILGTFAGIASFKDVWKQTA